MRTLLSFIFAMTINAAVLADVVPNEFSDSYDRLTPGERLVKSMESEQ